MPLRVGFIGLGIMGEPMARNCLRAGYPLTVWNRTRAKMERLLAEGAAAGAGCAEVAGRSDVTVTMVSDSPDVRQVILGDGGIIEGARPGSAVVDMSTISPEVTRHIAARLAERGIGLLDAPVSGGQAGAVAGTLSIMVGGEPEVFARCREVLAAMGRNIVHVGPSGMGQVTKLCNQITCALTLLAVCEGLAFGAKMGVDLNKMVEAIGGGAARSWQLENHSPKILAGDFAPGFMVRLMHKDLRLALEGAGESGAVLPGTALVHQLFTAAQAAGAGEQDMRALVQVIESLSGGQARK